MSKYLACCVLRRCGQLDGNEACCKRMKRNQYNIEYNDVINAFYPVGDRIDLRRIVLDHLWTSIKEENCAQFHKGCCVSRKNCNNEQSYCYPIPLRKKAINRTVVMMYAYYCADKAETAAAYAAAETAAAYAAETAAADAAADAAETAAAYAAAADIAAVAGAAETAAAYAADAAAGAAYAAETAAADAAETAAAGAETAAAYAGAAYAAAAGAAYAGAAAYAADAAAAAYAADAAAAGAREKFYREASVELIRLIDAWGSLR